MCQIFIGKKGRSGTHLAKIKDLCARNHDELWEENREQKRSGGARQTKQSSMPRVNRVPTVTAL